MIALAPELELEVVPVRPFQQSCSLLRCAPPVALRLVGDMLFPGSILLDPEAYRPR